jgi:rare lipoprotein A
MFNRSRQNLINQAPVFEPNSSFGFLRLLPQAVSALERAGAIIILISLLSSCEQCPVFAKNLTASWYSRASLIKEGTWKDGKERMMANGKKFSDNAFTCACNTYPLGTLLLVTAIESGRSVIVRTTDRTNKRFKGKRIDLAKRAFMAIADIEQGIVSVKVERIK